MKAVEYSPLLALLAVAPGLRRATDHTLSVYLPARAEGYDARHYDIVFGDVLHRYRERLGEKELVVLERDLPHVRTHVGIVKPAGCAAIAAFSDSEAGVMELVPLPLSSFERLEVGAPLLAPALRQIEQLPPALIVVVDKEQARLFGSILDQLRPISEIHGLEVHHSKAGGTSTLSNQRKAENRARANLRSDVNEVMLQLGSGIYSRLFTAGPDEARAEFDELLGEASAVTIAGHLSASLDSATLEHDLRSELAERRLAKAG